MQNLVSLCCLKPSILCKYFNCLILFVAHVFILGACTINKFDKQGNRIGKWKNYWDDKQIQAIGKYKKGWQKVFGSITTNKAI